MWRGPTRVIGNWHLARGLIRHGRLDLARHIAAQSIELAKKSGVREYYNPSTGAEWGTPDFSSSTVLIDLAKEVI